jgi:hypothetical protein
MENGASYRVSKTHWLADTIYYSRRTDTVRKRDGGLADLPVIPNL